MPARRRSGGVYPSSRSSGHEGFDGSIKKAAARIDIEAHKDDLGVERPTILVQVKSSDGQVNETAVSELYGKVSERDFGLFVALGGFNRRARDFGFSKRNLKLVDGDEIVELVYKYYDQLDGKYKGIIPLRRVFIPETLSE